MLHPNIYNAYNNGLDNIKQNKHVSVLTREDSSKAGKKNYRITWICFWKN